MIDGYVIIGFVGFAAGAAIVLGLVTICNLAPSKKEIGEALPGFVTIVGVLTIVVAVRVAANAKADCGSCESSRLAEKHYVTAKADAEKERQSTPARKGNKGDAPEVAVPNFLNPSNNEVVQ